MTTIFCMVASSIMIWTLLATEIYQSEAKIIVRPGREYLPVDADARDFSLSSLESFSFFLRPTQVLTLVPQLGCAELNTNSKPSLSTTRPAVC